MANLVQLYKWNKQYKQKREMIFWFLILTGYDSTLQQNEVTTG